MQARGMIALLAIVVAAMSVVCWRKNKESSPLLPVGDAPTSANEEVEKMLPHKKRGNHYDEI